MIIHDRFGVVVTLIAAVGALLAVLSLLRPRLLPAIRVYLQLTAATAGVQVIIGIVLVIAGQRPSQLLHWFYGAATLLAIPIAMYIGRSRTQREEALWVVGGAVAALLFAFRAIATG